MQLQTFSNETAFTNAFIGAIRAVCKNASTVRIALSGGSTPKPLYQALSKAQDIPFEKIEFFIVDERYVPANHPDSNQKMVREILIDPLKTKVKAFHFFKTDLPLEEAVKDYEKTLQPIALSKEGFDLVVLGIGPDGHTASLFPNSGALQETSRLVAHTQTEQFAIKDRLTITFPLILKSKQLLVLLKGSEKRTILEAIQKPSTTITTLPAKKLLEHSNLSAFLLVDAVGLEPTTLSV